MSGNLGFSREPLTLALSLELTPLLVDHWREIAHYADIPLDVDWPVYFAAEQRDALRVYTARNDSLIGYAVFFVRHAPHYTGSLQAVQDVVFVSPAHRGGVGALLIRFADDQLRAEGVQVVYHHAKLAHAALGKTLERMGYEPVETLYAKRLDRA